MRRFFRLQQVFWFTLLPQSWDRISLTEKFAWLFFINQTIAIITIIEMILLK